MMRINFSFFLCLLLAYLLTTTNAAALEAPKEFKEGLADSIQTTTSLSQHGITWTFADPVQFGQFVNGDYWVVDAGSGVKVTGILPGYTSTPRPMNGSMLNPSNMPQGYDSLRDYNQSKNVGIGISGETPLILSGNVSLVSTKSNEILGGAREDLYIETAAVLTCLSSPPPSGSFRPGISSTTKTLHNINNLDYSKIKTLSSPITKPDIQVYADYFQMVWLSHGSYWNVDYLHPSNSGLDNYYYPETFATAALMLHLDYSKEEKQKLLINYIQLGIDLYSFIECGGIGWEPDGGHGNGRKWPILFAGIMLNYTPMKNIGLVSGDYLYANGHGPGNPPAGYKHFSEDGQTFYVAQSDVDFTNRLLWDGSDCNYLANWCPDLRSAPNYPYTTAMIGMPEWGIRHSTDPRYSDASWGAMYRNIGSGAPAWAGFTLSARIMDARGLWNNNALFDYVDRYIAISKGKQDPFGYKVPGEVAANSASEFIKIMYDTYRFHY